MAAESNITRRALLVGASAATLSTGAVVAGVTAFAEVTPSGLDAIWTWQAANARADRLHAAMAAVRIDESRTLPAAHDQAFRLWRDAADAEGAARANMILALV